MDYSSLSDSNWEEELEEIAMETFLNGYTTNSRKFWARPINVEMDEKGVFLNIFPQLTKLPRKVSSILPNVIGSVYLLTRFMCTYIFDQFSFAVRVGHCQTSKVRNKMT